jgi:hypothetical protein
VDHDGRLGGMTITRGSSWLVITLAGVILTSVA